MGDGGGGRFVLNPVACTDNGGSMLNDSAGDCFYRTTSNYGPREWGAKGDGAADDTRALQNWLNNKALPNEPGLASQQERVGAGGTYKVTNTILCGDNTTIRANGTEYVGPGGGTYNGLPPFQIVADSTRWVGAAGAPLFQMENYCRISGVAIVANSAIDAVLIDGFHVLIDGHSTIIGGRSNITATGAGGGVQQTGFQIKDSQIFQASEYNLNFSTPNIRLIGNVISGAGIANIYYNGTELTIANGMIEESQGDGIILDGAALVKIIGNQINHNGKSADGGYGIRIRGGSQHIAITGNEMNKNNYGLAPGSQGSHILLQAIDSPLSDISFSGNVYSPFENLSTKPDAGLVPDYVYDVQSNHNSPDGGLAGNFSNVQLYEAPANQGVGVYSPNAQTVFRLLGLIP